MNKFKLFVDNFIVYGFGGIISKIIPLIMVPIVTRLMPSSDFYGVFDLSNTLVSFASALAIMGMYDAMYRMFFEKDDEEYKKCICSTALMFSLLASAVIFAVMILLREQIAQLFLNDKKYSFIIYLSAIATFVGATNSIVSAPTRMQNKRRLFLITNTLSPFISYSISIPMLVAGHYLLALPLATVISGVTMELTFAVINHSWFVPKKFDFIILKQLLVIAIPLLPNFLIYWVFNSCDKLMITNMIGISAAGIYSVGSKLGQCSQLIYTAFAGGWQYFAFSTMKEENQVKNNSLVFEYLGIITFVATAFVCALSYPLFQVLFTDQYLSGYIVAPYLFLAPLLQMLFQVAANQFLVVKMTWPNLFILSVGAVVNIVINLLLIPVIGIEGASIATLMGYVISDVICVIVLCKMRLMAIENRFFIAAFGMVLFFIAWRFLFPNNVVWGLGIAIVFSAHCVLLYKNDIRKFVKMVKIRN